MVSEKGRRIRIGTSGFSYDDWKGYFYPPDIRKGDMLSYYARHFNTVEINSTFYSIPHPATFWQMARKVHEGFEFVVKAPREITHDRQGVKEAKEKFLRAIQPAVEEGKFGCILAQFPWSFRPEEESARYLESLGELFQGYPVTFEFRNAGWVREETFDLLRRLGVGFCCVDEPRLKGLMPRVAVSTSSVAYFRFHGRNAEKWWKHEQPWERYDYLYNEGELKEWVPKIERVAKEAEKTYIFFNNHYQGKAAINAKMMAKLLDILSEPPGNTPSLFPLGKKEE